MEKKAVRTQSDFSKGPVWKCIVVQAIPLTIAQMVQLLYNIVDRIYIGHMEDGNSLALTGVGLTFPVVTLIMAFTALFGTGGVPLFSIARGAKDREKAGKILGNSFALLTVSAIILTAAGYFFCRPLLFLFGASEASYIYAREYLQIYLSGTLFSMLTTGLNGYINAQGFPKTGMMTTVLGAVINIVLDPIFYFHIRHGSSGSSARNDNQPNDFGGMGRKLFDWQKAVIKLGKDCFKPDAKIIKSIFSLGSSNFIMQGTNCLVQVVCNSTLQRCGGDIYVGVMTVLNSIREVFMLPVNGITNGGQPVISFNYGAGKNDRVKAGIRFNTIIGCAYTIAAWALIVIFPKFWFGIFFKRYVNTGKRNRRAQNLLFRVRIHVPAVCRAACISSARRCKACNFLFTPAQGNHCRAAYSFTADDGLWSKRRILAEPISNVIGGLASYITMRLTVYKRL